MIEAMETKADPTMNSCIAGASAKLTGCPQVAAVLIRRPSSTPHSTPSYAYAADLPSPGSLNDGNRGGPFYHLLAIPNGHSSRYSPSNNKQTRNKKVIMRITNTMEWRSRNTPAESGEWWHPCNFCTIEAPCTDTGWT